METSQNDNSTSWSLDDHRDLNYIRISSWKFMKAKKGGVYAIYPVHVFMKSGLHWTVDKRYSEFLDLHKELCRVFQKPRELEFPKKRWFFNFSEDCLVERKEKFEAYLTEILAMKPIPLELNYFLNVAQNLRYNAAGIENGMKRSASMGSLSAALSIHDFDLIKVLGQGSFGKVFLVRPVGAPAEEVYAMKALKKAEVEKRKQVDHTMAERRIMAMTTSPFVLRLRYAFQTPHKLYMVTDYCSGGELFFHLKKMRRFSESMMRFYTAELSMALHHLHARNIIYRDMKPENVLLDRFGHVKLTDFGLSKVLSSEVAADGTKKALYATTFCGTPEYLAPELIQHRRHNTGYSIDVDWWSLGIVSFELLTGWPPFFDKDFDRMCEKILKKPIRFPAKYSISPEAQQLIRGFLERNPNSRLGSRKSGGLGVLQTHPFFDELDWEALEKGQVRPPFVPLSGPDAADTRNFDSEFTKMSVKDAPNAAPEASVLDYEGFSYLDEEYKQLRGMCDEFGEDDENENTMYPGEYSYTEADDGPSMD
eukprot:CAMPEP_0185032604 /NCGR_PEP_ID=MMETSP1103-20130426/20806_1 /TAXON_ID=36769 /ORGANISM="Paraphysomonas bandaiensis, Strain Caron Lab Isolate" /LENGTH=535 /DNA_ID=CAMNT_0027568561 /DNA_START=137 /DNA_END=1744 /DNA_ORIENTATION=-